MVQEEAAKPASLRVLSFAGMQQADQAASHLPHAGGRGLRALFRAGRHSPKMQLSFPLRGPTIGAHHTLKKPSLHLPDEDMAFLPTLISLRTRDTYKNSIGGGEGEIQLLVPQLLRRC